MFQTESSTVGKIAYWHRYLQIHNLLMVRRINLFLPAVLILALGILIYLLDRPVSGIYFLPDILDLFQSSPGGFHDSLPSLLHAFAFSLLLLAGTAGKSTSSVAGICIGWWLIEVVLEGIQHSSLGPMVLAAVPEWINTFPVLENLPPYALQGTFDTLDILFAALGCSAAYFTRIYVRRKVDPC